MLSGGIVVCVILLGVVDGKAQVFLQPDASWGSYPQSPYYPQQRSSPSYNPFNPFNQAPDKALALMLTVEAKMAALYEIVKCLQSTVDPKNCEEAMDKVEKIFDKMKPKKNNSNSNSNRRKKNKKKKEESEEEDEDEESTER